VFHASASVSRWEKDHDGKYERATIAGVREARGEGEQGIVAHQYATVHSNGQSRANAQALDSNKSLVEMAAMLQTGGASPTYQGG